MKKTRNDAKDAANIAEAPRKSTIGKVKVACADIDGVLRGKYIHRDKVISAGESGAGFCDGGCRGESGEQAQDNAKRTGGDRGAPGGARGVRVGTGPFTSQPVTCIPAATGPARTQNATNSRVDRSPRHTNSAPAASAPNPEYSMLRSNWSV